MIFVPSVSLDKLTVISLKFSQKLRESIQRTQSVLCVGLDPDPLLIPFRSLDSEGTLEGFQTLTHGVHHENADRVYHFCKRIIEETAPHVAAFKLNTAFFEALGAAGWEVLEELSKITPDDSLLILDAKRGDIGNTSAKYAEALLERVGCDAVTLNPLMGLETFRPFTQSDQTGVYALALTSNPGASQFLMRQLSDGKTLSETIACDLKAYAESQDCDAAIGMVVGATQPDSARSVLEAYEEAPLLIPGIGAQGGDPAKWASLLSSHKGLPLFNSSRGIMYAGNSIENSSSGQVWTDAVLEAVTQTNIALKPAFEACRHLL